MSRVNIRRMNPNSSSNTSTPASSKTESSKITQKIITTKAKEPSPQKKLGHYDQVFSLNPLEELEIEKEISEVFQLFDYDKSGTISKEELSKFLYSIGKPFSEEDLADIFKQVDLDNNSTITLQELMFYLKTKVFYIQENKVDEIIECFKVFDSDNDMKLTKKEIEKIMKKYDINHISQEDIDLFFQLTDKNGDQTISYSEFVEMWKSTEE